MDVAGHPPRVRVSLEELAGRARAGSPAPGDRVADGYRRAAVMVLFTPAEGTSPALPGVDLFLVQRADHLRHHPGEIALPGGRIEDDDADEAAAALRELAEETGIDPAAVEALGRLTPQLVPVSRNVVTPVLGWSDAVGDAGEVEPGEVVHTIRVPVAELLDPAARATVRVLDRRTPGFATRNGWVWGFTGLLLDHVFTELGWTRPWDPAREVHMGYDDVRKRVVVRPGPPVSPPGAAPYASRAPGRTA